MSLRAYIRQIITEQEENSRNLKLKKGEWHLLSPGTDDFELAKMDLWDIINTTYEYAGGHVKLPNPESLNRYQFWVVKDLDRDDKIDVAIFGKPEFGVKSGGAANDGSSAAAAEYKSKSADLRKGGSVAGIGNWWGEISGKPAFAMITRGAPAIENENEVAALLGGDDYTWHGEHPDPDAHPVFQSVKGWYTKNFGGKSHTKIILGNPSL